MGRRLNALEELQASFAQFDADRQQGRAQLRQHYLERIADTLGITIAELGEAPALPRAVEPTTDSARPDEFILTQQCRDLIEAFSRVQDPQDRLRCLEIVREAARIDPLEPDNTTACAP